MWLQGATGTGAEAGLEGLTKAKNNLALNTFKSKAKIVTADGLQLGVQVEVMTGLEARIRGGR